MPELKENYWVIPIQDSALFSKIRTPDWASHAATEMVKEWFGGDVELEREAHIRSGQFKNSTEWSVQGVLIPARVILKGKVTNVDQETAEKIACYIAGRIDKVDYC